jgi:hypothetical protein
MPGPPLSMRGRHRRRARGTVRATGKPGVGACLTVEHARLLRLLRRTTPVTPCYGRAISRDGYPLSSMTPPRFMNG